MPRAGASSSSPGTASSRALGLGEDEIRDVPHWRTSEHYDEAESPGLACTDGLVPGGRVPDGTFEALRRHFSDAEILLLTYIACTYEMRATNFRVLRSEFDDREEPVVEVEAPEGCGGQDDSEDIAG